MTEVPITQPGDAPEPGELTAPETAKERRGRPLLVTAALLLPLIGIATVLVFVFQPFADAAGGCGGG
ncbi:MAG TPA: hypothetical protein VN695_07535 [Streptosporangiaceae bacterium]|nr:hypothetical protein [Streptosporangiaceae bacterium]